MIKTISVFQLIRVGSWVFRTSISDSERIMIMAFGPKSELLIRFFLDAVDARAWVDECAEGKHVE